MISVPRVKATSRARTASSDASSNALLLAPPGDFTFRYGPGSYHAHLAEAAARDRAIHIGNAPGLRFDLDTEGDWLAYRDCLIQVVDEL